MSTTDKWQDYHQKSLSQPHRPLTERAVAAQQSPLKLAIDCGCGTGNDLLYLLTQGYEVHGFDNNSRAIELSMQRLATEQSGKARLDTQAKLTVSSFESYDYPKAGLIIAHASLFFAQPTEFAAIWRNIVNSLVSGGVFAGDFLGVKDSWAEHEDPITTSLDQAEIMAMFEEFDLLEVKETDRPGAMANGQSKHWHYYSVLARKK